MNQLVDGLKHLRLIHFTLLLVTATTGYLVYASYSIAPETLREAQAFEKLVQSLASEAPSLDLLNPAWSERSFQASPLGAAYPGKEYPDRSYRVLWRFPLEPDLPVGRIARQLEAPYSTEVEVLHGPLEGDDFLDRVRRLVGGADSPLNPWFRSHLYSKWREDRSADVEVVLSCTTPSLERPGERGLAAAQQMIREEETGRLTTRIERVEIARDWKTRFSTLFELDNLDELDLEGLIDFAQGDLTSGLSVKNPTLAGLELEGRHVGIVGPVLILVLLVYMVLYLRELHGSLDRQVDFEVAFLPWIGAMPSRWAGFLAWLTLLAFPAIVNSFAIYRLVWPNRLAVSLLVLPAALLGAVAAWSTRFAAARLLDLRSARAGSESGGDAG